MGLLDSDLAPMLGGLLSSGWNRFRGVDPATGETDYWKRGGLAGLLGMPSWDEQPPTDIAMGFAGSTTPAVKGLMKGVRAYHGSPDDFPRFDIGKAGSRTDPGALGRALYFSTDSKVAEGLRDQGKTYGGAPHKYEVDLAIKNPLAVTAPPGWEGGHAAEKVRVLSDRLGIEPPRVDLTTTSSPDKLSAWRRWSDEVARIVSDRGHDAVVYDYSPKGYPHQEIAVFDDSLISILRKYGLLGPMAGGATAGAVGDY